MKAQLVVLTNAVDGQDGEFDRWYDDVHLGQVCAVPGVVSAARSRAPDGDARYRSCAIYQIEHDGPQEVVAEITRRYQSGEMTPTAAMDSNLLMQLYVHGTSGA